MGDSMISPDLEKRLQVAEDLQQHWQFVLDLLDGEIAEAMRHGWDESQSRLLVFATYMHTTLGPIMGNKS